MIKERIRKWLGVGQDQLPPRYSLPEPSFIARYAVSYHYISTKHANSRTPVVSGVGYAVIEMAGGIKTVQDMRYLQSIITSGSLPAGLSNPQVVITSIHEMHKWAL